MRRALTPAASLLLVAATAAAWTGAACTRVAELPVVRVHVSPDLDEGALSAAAAWSKLGRVALVPRPAEAELAWLSDPVAALALGERAAPGSAPASAGVPPRHADPQGRFAPLGARTRALIPSRSLEGRSVRHPLRTMWGSGPGAVAGSQRPSWAGRGCTQSKMKSLGLIRAQ